jgi:PHP family Zn ribbon phosphoesterase
MLPGVGPRTYEELSGKLGTEIDIMYTVSLDALADVAGSNLARQIEAVRSGQVSILPGGGGKYGKVTKVR